MPLRKDCLQRYRAIYESFARKVAHRHWLVRGGESLMSRERLWCLSQREERYARVARLAASLSRLLTHLVLRGSISEWRIIRSESTSGQSTG